ncbi:hypothetical protein GCM10007874_14090 [Labrys miyagiensis]|uniref:Amidohydrolase-related domain-containing protein n=1 Tax=Labrys miyagiensis TaxID=346912 RepID=A0ABQ6CDG7_9HYPH|nr:hypothetical protein GCM10007874_14090 [Labrys miyagiensis]
MLPILSGCASDPAYKVYPSDPDRPPEIDVHSHIFNVHDLPIYNFLTKVELSGELGKWLSPAALFIVSMVTSRAPTGEMEEKQLKLMRLSGSSVGTDDPRRDPVQMFVEGVNRFIDEHIESQPRGLLARDNNLEFLRFLYQYPRFPPQNGLLLDAEAELAYYRINAARIATQAGTNRHPRVTSRLSLPTWDEVVNFIKSWAPLWSKYRYRLASQLENVAGPNEPIRFVAPAILDSGNWLPDDPGYKSPPSTSLAQQARIMRLISLVQPPGVAVHGYIGFDPLRYIKDQQQGNSQDALAIVRAAVETQGFVGVKVYPPMGFRAIGNADLGDDCFPPHVRMKHLGVLLDRALTELYSYCVDNDVPILTHCSHSQGPDDRAMQRAHPRYWRRLLDIPKFRSLRLNLGHAGGIFDYDKPTDSNVWTNEVADMLGRYPNLYADVSDLAIVTATSGKDKAQKDAILANVSKLPDCAKARLMYGTDWLLMGRYGEAGTYRDAMRTAMGPVLGADLDNFFSGNAAAFLGLSDDKGTRGRLKAFYKANSKNDSILDKFYHPRIASLT